MRLPPEGRARRLWRSAVRWYSCFALGFVAALLGDGLPRGAHASVVEAGFRNFSAAGCPIIHFWDEGNCGGIQTATSDSSWHRSSLRYQSAMDFYGNFHCCPGQYFDTKLTECPPQYRYPGGGSAAASCVFSDSYCPLLEIPSTTSDTSGCSGVYIQVSATEWSSNLFPIPNFSASTEIIVHFDRRSPDGRMVLECKLAASGEYIGAVQFHICHNSYTKTPLVPGLNALSGSELTYITSPADGGSIDYESVKGGVLADLAADTEWKRVWFLSESPLMAGRDETAVFTQGSSSTSLAYQAAPLVPQVTSADRASFYVRVVPGADGCDSEDFTASSSKFSVGDDDAHDVVIVKENVSFVLVKTGLLRLPNGALLEVIRSPLYGLKERSFSLTATEIAQSQDEEVPFIIAQVQNVLLHTHTTPVYAHIASRSSTEVAIQLRGPSLPENIATEIAILVIRHPSKIGVGPTAGAIHARYFDSLEEQFATSAVEHRKFLGFLVDSDDSQPVPYVSLPLIFIDVVEPQDSTDELAKLSTIGALSNRHFETHVHSVRTCSASSPREAAPAADATAARVAALTLGKTTESMDSRSCRLVLESTSFESMLFVSRMLDDVQYELRSVAANGDFGTAAIGWNRETDELQVVDGPSALPYLRGDSCPPDGTPATYRAVQASGNSADTRVGYLYRALPPTDTTCIPVSGAEISNYETVEGVGVSIPGVNSLVQCAQVAVSLQPAATAVAWHPRAEDVGEKCLAYTGIAVAFLENGSAQGEGVPQLSSDNNGESGRRQAAATILSNGGVDEVAADVGENVNGGDGSAVNVACILRCVPIPGLAVAQYSEEVDSHATDALECSEAASYALESSSIKGVSFQLTATDSDDSGDPATGSGLLLERDDDATKALDLSETTCRAFTSNIKSLDTLAGGGWKTCFIAGGMPDSLRTRHVSDSDGGGISATSLYVPIAAAAGGSVILVAAAAGTFVWRKKSKRNSWAEDDDDSSCSSEVEDEFFNAFHDPSGFKSQFQSGVSTGV